MATFMVNGDKLQEKATLIQEIKVIVDCPHKEE
jgi:hypothetical protein